MDLFKHRPKTKLIFLWLVSNYFAWPVGMILSIILSHLTVGFFFEQNTNMIVGAVTATTIGLAQWLVIIKFQDLKKWWIFVPGIVFGIPFAVITLQHEAGNELPLLFDSEAVFLSLVYSVCALISGSIQSQIASMTRLESFAWISSNILASIFLSNYYSFFYAGLIVGFTTLPAFIMLLNHKKPDSKT